MVKSGWRWLAVSKFKKEKKQQRITTSDQIKIVQLPRLLTVNETIFDTVPTITKMRDLYDNYVVDSYSKETVTPTEQIEENDFIREILNTTVMKAAMTFLQRKGQFPMHTYENLDSIEYCCCFFPLSSKELYHQNTNIKWNCWKRSGFICTLGAVVELAVAALNMCLWMKWNVDLQLECTIGYIIIIMKTNRENCMTSITRAIWTP